MTDNTQPEAFCWATELAMVRDPVTLTVKEAREVSDEMQRMHAENETLRIGYAAARLEIEALRAAQEAPAAVAGPSGRLSDELRSVIEGMTVSVDVSTGDHDAGHRYFGTVTEVMDDIADKHGVTLLVQDAKPNFAAAPTTQPSPASQENELDTARLDWLDKNIFYREMPEWDAKHGHGSGYNMWVLFAPKVAQGSARKIIDAARARLEGKP